MLNDSKQETNNHKRRRAAREAAAEAKRLAMEAQYKHVKLRLDRPKKARVTGHFDRALVKRERGGFATVKFALPGRLPTVAYSSHVGRNYI